MSEPSRDGALCPLCASTNLRLVARLAERPYFECPGCALVHLAPDHRLDTERERAHYDLHENDPADPNYRTFLDRLARPLAERLRPGASGLDYGSGPGPTLSVMLEERGFSMAIYDPFFAPDPAPLARTYDFITCSETVEHFFRPLEELERLSRLVRPKGLVALMTEMVPEDRPFEQWSYARDPTHVCFYRPATMRWIGRRFGWALESLRGNVVLFRAR